MKHYWVKNITKYSRAPTNNEFRWKINKKNKKNKNISIKLNIFIDVITYIREPDQQEIILQKNV